MKLFPVFLLLIALLSDVSELTAEELTVVYTANSNGKLMYCNCPGDKFGGLSERVTLMGDLRKKMDMFLLVDAGNMVGLYEDYDLKASVVVRMMNLMGYNTAGTGRNEIFRGIPRFKKAVKKSRFPIVSATFADKTTGKLLFEPYAVAKIGETKVAITSVCDSTLFNHMKKADYGFTVLPVEKALQGIIGVMSRAGAFIVVLSLMPPEKNVRLLETFPAIDLIVEGYGNESYDPPETTPNGVIVSPGTYGEYVGSVTIDKSNGKVTVCHAELIPVIDIPEDNKAHKLVLEYYHNRK